MSHITPRVVITNQHLDKMYYSKATLPSNLRESIFPTAEENTSDVDQMRLSHSLERIGFEDAPENHITTRPTERLVKRDLPCPKAPSTLEDMIAHAAQLFDKTKRSRANYQKLMKEYDAGVVSHNQLAEEIDQLKIEKNRLKMTCNHQEEELACYRALLCERGLDDARSNSKSPELAVRIRGSIVFARLIRVLKSRHGLI